MCVCVCDGINIWRFCQVSKGRPSVAFKAHRTLLSQRSWLDLQQQPRYKKEKQTQVWFILDYYLPANVVFEQLVEKDGECMCVYVTDFMRIGLTLTGGFLFCSVC